MKRMTTQTVTYVTPDEYLAFERRTETKNEYADGVVYEVPGANVNHVLIVAGLATEIGLQLRTWSYTAAEGLESSLALPSIECTLNLSAVYDKVDFNS
jgi:hypothetical protein